MFSRQTSCAFSASKLCFWLHLGRLRPAALKMPPPKYSANVSSSVPLHVLVTSALGNFVFDTIFGTCSAQKMLPPKRAPSLQPPIVRHGLNDQCYNVVLKQAICRLSILSAQCWQSCTNQWFYTAGSQVAIFSVEPSTRDVWIEDHVKPKK